MQKETLSNLPSAKLSPFAENDLRETWLYISENSLEFADKTIKELLQKFNFLAINPKIGTTKDKIILGLRLFPYKNHNIYYFITDFGVEIYRVLHSSRDNIQVFDTEIDKLN